MIYTTAMGPTAPRADTTGMKVVILAGGLGTRLAEETHVRPKPMVEVGGRPILWHIMKLYSSHGLHDFVVCCGYKGYLIKEYFSNYFLHSSDVTFDMAANSMEVHSRHAEPWRVTLVDTGEATQTGGRLRRVREYLDTDAPFCFTYGDGVGDGDGNRINGGFFVLDPSVIDYVDGDATVWEREPLERLAAEGELAAFAHDGFWQPMDTLRDRQLLEELWQGGRAPWKRWA
jgi:glucose-1-phosphate cytidylyltransferase